EHGACLRVGHLLDGGEEAVPGVVHDDVDPAEAVGGGGDGLRHLRLVGEVDGQGEQARRVGAREGAEETLGRAGGRRDVLAAVEELADELEAEAARGAGDEPGGGTVGGVGHEDSFGGSGPARRADVSRLLSEGPSWGAAPCPAGPGSARPRTARPPRDGALGGAGGGRDPTRAGRPADGRAGRGPGLRREEVAFLAGVSTDYYARLEQGRRITPSPAVVDAIGRALALDAAGRAHLADLVGLGT